MYKTLIAIIAAGTVGAAWADASIQQQQYQDQFRERPEARAYLSYSFGGGNHVRQSEAPLHYGLRLDHGSRIGQSSGLNGGMNMPALFQIDRDSRGTTLASTNGMLFAGHNLRLNQDDSGSGSGGGSQDGGWSFFDWSLLAVGVAGAGFLIYHATEGHDSPDAKKSSSGSSGSGSSSGGSGSGSSSGGGLLCKLLGTCLGDGSAQAADAERPDPGYIRWLDGGNGHMGDIGGS